VRIASGVSAVVELTNNYARQLGSFQELALERARASQVFEQTGTGTGAAGQSFFFQAFNPVGSGKTVVVLVYEVSANLAVNLAYTVSLHNVALTTLVGAFINVNSGAAAASCEFRTQSIAGFPGTLVRTGARGGDPNAGGTSPEKTGYYVLSAGKGLVVGPSELGSFARGFMRIWEF